MLTQSSVNAVQAKQRARPLPPEDRRQAIVDAVIPLLIEKGARVTTAEMAAAAGIAEGTIFRVFPDKTALIQDAVKASFDPRPDLERLKTIDPAGGLERAVRQVAEILATRFDRLHTLVAVVRSITSEHPGRGGKKMALAANRKMLEAVTSVLSPHRDSISVPPDRAAAILNSLMFAIHFPVMSADRPVTVEEAVTTLLDGIRADESHQFKQEKREK